MRHSSILFLAFLIVSSCAESIVMDPLEEMPVVVNCVLTREEGKEDGAIQCLDLYYAKRPNESSYTLINDAEVYIEKGDVRYDFTYNGDRWESEFLPEFGNRYHLIITIPGKDKIEAVTCFPLQQKLCRQPLMRGGLSRTSMGAFYYIGDANFKEWEQESLFWIVALDSLDNAITYICSDHTGIDDFNICNGKWSNLNYIHIFRDCDQTFVPAGGVIYRPSQTHPEIWDSYENSCMDIPLHNTFLRVRHRAKYDSGKQRLLLNKDDESTYQNVGHLFSLDADFPLSHQTIIDEQSHLNSVLYNGLLRYRVIFLSEEYDCYLRMMTEKSFIGSDELTRQYSADKIYTNIDGGFGVFGSQWISYCSCNLRGIVITPISQN